MTRARLGLMGLIVATLIVFLLDIGLGRGGANPDPARLLSDAQADYQAGNYDSAADKLAQLAKSRTPTPMDRMARALVARARGEDGLSELAQIPDDHPLSSEAHLLAGQIEAAKGRLRPAESHFLAALARDRSNIHAHHELAALYNTQARWREMEEQMIALSDLNAIDFDHLVHWGKTKNGIWNSRNDCKSLAKSLEVDPDDRNSRLALVDGLRKLGNITGAASVLSFLPEADPEARARRALLALELGDRKRAGELLAGGPADDPSLAKARGQLALSEGDAAGALRYLKMALAARPGDFSLLAAMATALRVMGKKAEAQAYLDAEQRHANVTPLIVQATTDLGRNDRTLPARLGSACEAAGRVAEARAWYRLAITRDPLDSQAQQALFRLGNDRNDQTRSTDASANVGRSVGSMANSTDAR
jgi:tetratricopeptide (TPR) repeat protein